MSERAATEQSFAPRGRQVSKAPPRRLEVASNVVAVVVIRGSKKLLVQNWTPGWFWSGDLGVIMQNIIQETCGGGGGKLSSYTHKLTLGLGEQNTWYVPVNKMR